MGPHLKDRLRCADNQTVELLGTEPQDIDTLGPDPGPEHAFSGRSGWYPRIGIDHVAHEDVSASIAAFGDKYLNRIFTPDEQRYAADGGPLQVQRLSARFAAKEAVRKILRPRSGLSFAGVSVVHGPDGEPRLSFDPKAEALAASVGVRSWSISITHSFGHSAAAVIAMCSHR